MIDTTNLPESKLLILYILNKVGTPITNNVLSQIYYTINDLNYFYFQQYLAELVDTKWIATFEEEDNIFYMITPDGINALQDLMYLLPPIITSTANKALDSAMKGLNYSLSVDADFIILDVDKINVNCSISEGTSKLFALEIYAGTMNQARKIAENWKKNALKLYPDIIKMLTIDKEEN